MHHRFQEVSNLLHMTRGKQCLAYLPVNSGQRVFIFPFEYFAARVAMCEGGTDSSETYKKDSVEGGASS